VKGGERDPPGAAGRIRLVRTADDGRASLYPDQGKTVLYVDTAVLLARHADRVRLAPMNTGCTKPWPHPRGPDTFASLADYPYEEHQRRRRGDAVVDLAVEGCVPDIADLVVRVEEIDPSGKAEVVFER
jgi:hypothetical protein